MFTRSSALLILVDSSVGGCGDRPPHGYLAMPPRRAHAFGLEGVNFKSAKDASDSDDDLEVRWEDERAVRDVEAAAGREPETTKPTGTNSVSGGYCPLIQLPVVSGGSPGGMFELQAVGTGGRDVVETM